MESVFYALPDARVLMIITFYNSLFMATFLASLNGSWLTVM